MKQTIVTRVSCCLAVAIMGGIRNAYQCESATDTPLLSVRSSNPTPFTTHGPRVPRPPVSRSLARAVSQSVRQSKCWAISPVPGSLAMNVLDV